MAGRTVVLAAMVVIAVAAAAGCSSGPAAPPTPTAASLSVLSSAFRPNGRIPAMYTCDGRGASLPVSWSGAPPKTRAFALILRDANAPGGGYTHWLLYDIPRDVLSLGAGSSLPTGTIAGASSNGTDGYTPPCPPKGASAHHYHLMVYALNSPLAAPAGLSEGQLIGAMKGHILAWGEIVGVYSR